MKAAILPTLFSTVTSMMMNAGQSDSSAADDLAAERAAREEETRQGEAEERKRTRDKQLEAREMEQKKLANAQRNTLLATGGAGLTDQATVSASQLKKTLGE